VFKEHDRAYYKQQRKSKIVEDGELIRFLHSVSKTNKGSYTEPQDARGNMLQGRYLQKGLRSKKQKAAK